MRVQGQGGQPAIPLHLGLLPLAGGALPLIEGESRGT
jgi:hypothetical protein